MAEQVCIMYALDHDFLAEIPVGKIRDYEQGLYKHMEEQHDRVLKTITQTGVLDEQTEEQLKEILTAYTEQYRNNNV